MINSDQPKIGDTMNNILSPADAIALGELLTGLSGHRKVRWLTSEGIIVDGELRSLIRGKDNFASLQWGVDVRDAWVHITTTTGESVRRLVKLIQEGGCMIATGNSAGTSMVRIEGNDLETLRTMLSGKSVHLLRVDQRSDTVAFKVNEGIWTRGMGKPQPPY